jgi:hypothetical protein
MAKALAEFIFHRLSEIKQVRVHNSSENGRCAWVALCAHPTHTDMCTQ